MNEKLKPCPFCGGNAMFLTITNKSSQSSVGVMFKIKCMKCRIEFPKSYECEMYMDQDGGIRTGKDEIDADALVKRLEKSHEYHAKTSREEVLLFRDIRIINEQPTAYDPDKIVEQLENERKFWENAYNRNLGKEKARSYEHAIEIVKGGGVDAKTDS